MTITYIQGQNLVKAKLLTWQDEAGKALRVARASTYQDGVRPGAREYSSRCCSGPSEPRSHPTKERAPDLPREGGILGTQMCSSGKLYASFRTSKGYHLRSMLTHVERKGLKGCFNTKASFCPCIMSSLSKRIVITEKILGRSTQPSPVRVHMCVCGGGSL